MSTPVRYCDLLEAARNAEKFRLLHPVMHENLKAGAFTVLPCNHTPQCPAMDWAEQKVLATRFQEVPLPPPPGGKRRG